MHNVPRPDNEPVLSYAPGSAERGELQAEVQRQSQSAVEIPLHIGGQPVQTSKNRAFSAPHRHSLELGVHAVVGDAEVQQAVQAALEAHEGWSQADFETRAAVFLRAAELLSGPWRQRLNAATVLNQSKTAHQAEIDAACELIDFLRFNVHYAARLMEEQPNHGRGTWNRLQLRSLEGFVYAVTPFNFTAIAGNLPSAPALMGNTVIWKPSPHAVLSAHRIMELLVEAGLPDGVINLVFGDAEAITRTLLARPEFSGLHFTGSTAVLRQLFHTVGQNVERYKSYPRIVGESGGKDFIVAHGSADVRELAVAIVRGGYEFQGQKCSAASRLYIARSLWPALEKELCDAIGEIKIGDPAHFENFMGAVISRAAFDKITSYQQLAKNDHGCRVVAGGGGSDAEGYFIEPTLIEVSDPKHRLMQEEIFGPVVTAFIYEDDRFDQALELCDSSSQYALTGAIFARDRGAVALATERLKNAAGNFYVNDKPTGAVVGQQPFGGARLSGTNDKAGSAFNLMRWASPRVIKENLSPPRDWRYPFMRS